MRHWGGWWSSCDAFTGSRNASRRPYRKHLKIGSQRHTTSTWSEFAACQCPPTDSRALFVHHVPPVGQPLTAQTVRVLVRRAFARCGIPASGSYILRHTWATWAHRRGAGLKLIADLLGHRSLGSTTRYAHVNLEELRQAALPWPKINP